MKINYLGQGLIVYRYTENYNTSLKLLIFTAYRILAHMQILTQELCLLASLGGIPLL